MSKILVYSNLCDMYENKFTYPNISHNIKFL